MTPFDHYVKHTLGVKYYVRYVDDFVIVHRDKEYLKSLVPVLEEYLDRELSLTLHPRKRWLQHYSKGVTFLGSDVKFGSVRCGKRTKTGMYRVINDYNALSQGGGLDAGELRSFRCSMNSYWGLMRHMDTYKLRRRSAEKFDPGILKQVSVNGYRKVSINKNR